VGIVLSRKEVHNWVEQRGKYFADEEVETEVRKWLRQQSKYFCAPGFDALVKRWDRCIDIGGGYVDKCFFFSRFEYRTFYVLYPFLTCLLTLAHTNTTRMNGVFQKETGAERLEKWRVCVVYIKKRQGFNLQGQS
jgi:hypothetical protein